MTDTTTTTPFWMGLRDGLPFIFVVGPFALLFGVVATEAGLDVLTALGFSVVVIAGASQFTALSLMADNAPVWVAIFTALAVNLRMAMYSASLTPYLGAAPMWKRALVAYLMVDQTYALSVARFEQNPGWSVAARLSYYFGAMVPICPLWYALTVVGALLGSTIPESLALDFAVPITFIAMVGPMLRTLPHVAAAVTSVVLALALMGLPAGLGLILSAIIAMMVGAQVERMMETRHGG